MSSVDKTLFRGANNTQSNTSFITVSELNRMRNSLPPLSNRGSALPEIERSPPPLPKESDLEKRFKEAERKKQEQIEAEHRRFSEELASRKAAERKASIERAKQLSFLQDDKVKTLRSVIIEKTIVKERDSQLQHKKQKEDQERYENEQYGKYLEIEKNKAVEEEKKKKLEEWEKQKEVAAFRQDQLTQLREKEAREKEQIIREGLKLRSESEKLKEQMDNEKRLKQERIAQMQRQILEDNAKLQSLQLENRLKERKEDDKIEDYSKERERILAERKRIEQERFESKQQIRMRLIDAQAERLEAMRVKEEKRLEQDMRALDQKREEEKKRQEERRLQQNQEEERYRAEVRARKIDLEMQMRADDNEFLRNLKEKEDAEMEREKAKQEEMRRKNKEVKSFLSSQAEQKRSKSSLEKMVEMQELEDSRRQSEEQEQAFNEYMQKSFSHLDHEQTLQATKSLLKISGSPSPKKPTSPNASPLSTLLGTSLSPSQTHRSTVSR
eukprot:TRINITY_DN5914_c0_g2_i1.p1 TRINITY_DN5914_c0_g2~~TRINITY_DN5914_c0_g2_i1.p1  ORF type:complete len:499 (-),score=146.94 TRINITY_DN5914_c0_g2_i1:26-1522(-)